MIFGPFCNLAEESVGDFRKRRSLGTKFEPHLGPKMTKFGRNAHFSPQIRAGCWQLNGHEDQFYVGLEPPNQLWRTPLSMRAH